MTKTKTAAHTVWGFCFEFWTFEFWYCFGFRYSDFGFISLIPARTSRNQKD